MLWSNISCIVTTVEQKRQQQQLQQAGFCVLLDTILQTKLVELSVAYFLSYATEELERCSPRKRRRQSGPSCKRRRNRSTGRLRWPDKLSDGRKLISRLGGASAPTYCLLEEALLWQLLDPLDSSSPLACIG